LITDKKVSTMKELMGVLEPVAPSGRAPPLILPYVQNQHLLSAKGNPNGSLSHFSSFRGRKSARLSQGAPFGLKDFACCGKRPKTLSLETASLLKKA